MGNYKFRFSNMIPNAWFYKLKDMNNPKSHPPPPPLQSHTSEFTKQQPHLSEQRKSYYFTRDLTFQPHSHKKNPAADPPRRRRRRSTKRNPAATTCSCHATADDSPPSPEESTNSGLNPGRNQSSSSEPDSVLTEYGSDRDNPCKCHVRNDVTIDIIDHRRLPRIITKPRAEVGHRTSAEFTERNAYNSLSVKVVKEDFLTETSSASVRKSSPGLKLRMNSPKIANRRIQGRRSVSSSSSSASRRSISDSLAVVKASKNPRRDFEESMVEMIVENNIKASKDLEELLACYLSLNSDEYHELIINVFKQIWFDFIHLRIK